MEVCSTPAFTQQVHKILHWFLEKLRLQEKNCLRPRVATVVSNITSVHRLHHDHGTVEKLMNQCAPACASSAPLTLKCFAGVEIKHNHREHISTHFQYTFNNFKNKKISLE